MARIRVRTEIEAKGFNLVWKDNRVELESPTPDRESEWNYIQSLGLYGKYGHMVDLQNCYLTDLVIALSVVLGPDKIQLDSESKNVMKAELSEELAQPLPLGAIT